MDKAKKNKKLMKELIEQEIQTHHISYDPEITIDILKDLHTEYHGHGTGPAKGVVQKKPRKIPIPKMSVDINSPGLKQLKERIEKEVKKRIAIFEPKLKELDPKLKEMNRILRQIIKNTEGK